MLPAPVLPMKGRLSMNIEQTSKREGPYAYRPADAKTGAWRQERPVVDPEKCNGCGTCTRYCPAGILEVVDKKLQIEYTYCKGCGVCVTVCPRRALEMVPEEEGQNHASA